MLTLEAVEFVLRQADRSMHSREIAEMIIAHSLAKLTGRTPWKTVNARISEDILEFGAQSKFMRTSHGLFALREWEFAAEFEVKRRRLNPIDEDIRVVSANVMRDIESKIANGTLLDVPFEVLVEQSFAMGRREAELTDEVVQLIPTFVVRKQRRLLTYTRTKRLPEARLHNVRSMSFGGHMQADDDMPLFRGESIYRDSVLRELREELSFSRQPKPVYVGLLHLHGNLFERQHAGLIFDVPVAQAVKIESLEPGMHADVKFTDLEDLKTYSPRLDSWSRLLVGVFDGLA